MRRIVAYCAASLDGFIAGPGDDLDWLPAITPTETGYDEFFAGVGALAMGRRTYELVRSFGDWPYGGTPTYVLSRSLPPGPIGPAVVTDAPVPSVARMLQGAAADDDVAWLVGGAEVFGAFAAHGLIDEWIVTVVPVILAAGTPLVSPRTPRQPLRLLGSRELPGDCVQVRYRSL